jgi:hypothetical protein
MCDFSNRRIEKLEYELYGRRCIGVGRSSGDLCLILRAAGTLVGVNEELRPVKRLVVCLPDRVKDDWNPRLRPTRQTRGFILSEESDGKRALLSTPKRSPTLGYVAMP